MIDRDEAQQRAQNLVKEFLYEAQPGDMHDAGNLLMLLASVVGLTLVQAVGHQQAIERLQGTVDYITKSPKGRAPLVTPPRLPKVVH